MSGGLAAHVELERLIDIHCLRQVELFDSVLSQGQFLLSLSLHQQQLVFPALHWIRGASSPG